MVLEAREKAEEVGYSLVGQETKDASNVIDYSINKEQTKDISYEINANNQTTTGMATVIPGINTPKLIYNTSILGGGGGRLAELTGTGTSFPAQDMTDFNQWTVSIASPDVSLDANHPTRIYLAQGVYIIYYYINISKNDSFIYTSFCVSERLVLGYAPVDFGGRVNFTTLVKVLDGEWIDLAINPNSNANSSSCIVRLVKLS